MPNNFRRTRGFFKPSELIASPKTLFFWTSNQQPTPVAADNVHITFKAVSSSGRHFAVITEDGNVFVWGNGTSGQLGQGELRNIQTPFLLEFFRNINVGSIYCAAAQSAVITKDGQVYTWGWRGDEPVSSPQLVSELSAYRVSKVCLGAYHVLAIVENSNSQNDVYAWGQNDKGQLGNGSTIPIKSPVKLDSLNEINVVDICATETTSAAITDAGDVWVWGNNAEGISLGINSNEEIITSPTLIDSLKGIPIKQIDFGVEFGVALSTTGIIYTWGKNTNGQLGHGDKANRTKPTQVDLLKEYIVVGISCGNRNMIAWTLSGDIFSWGSNSRNELGFPNMKDVPLLSQPKRMENLPDSSIIYDAACGHGSLALIGVAKIQLRLNEDHFYEELVTPTQTIGQLKEFIVPLWGLEEKHVVFQDENGQLLSRQQNLRKLILEGRYKLRIIMKEDVQVTDKEDIKFIFDESDIPRVRLGSVERLFQWLINPCYPSEEYLQEFLYTYRKFISPIMLMDSLINAYQYSLTNTEKNRNTLRTSQMAQAKESYLIQQRIVEVIRTWLIDHQNDFFLSDSSSELLTGIHKFIEILSKQDKALAIELTRLYHQMDPNKEKPRMLKDAPTPLKRSGSGIITFFSYPAQEIARQLCIIAYELFSKIQSKELIGQGWMKADKNIRSPNVIKMIQYSNNLSTWVVDTILSQPTTKKKMRAYEKFVEVCLCCMDLKNYNSLMDLIGGLQSHTLLKQLKTWPDFLKSSNVETVEKITKMMISRNKAGLREKVKYAFPPCIPFLGMFLQDILYIEDGNPDFIDGLINFGKCSLIASSIKDIKKFQKIPYEFQKVSELRILLKLDERPKKSTNTEPASAQITFLNNTSSILVDRNKTTDLKGERTTMWIQWCEKADNDSSMFYTEDGVPRTFISVLLESFAIENSVFSALMLFPQNDFEIDLLKRLLNHSFIPEIDINDMTELLQVTKNLGFPGPLRATFAQAICTFKNVLPHPTIYPSISKFSDEFLEESDDFSVLKGKRKRCNRAAMRLCKVATIMGISNDKMEIFPLLYRGLNDDHIAALHGFVNSQNISKIEELEDLIKTREELKNDDNQEDDKDCKDNDEIRNLEQQKRQTSKYIEDTKSRIDDIDNQSSYLHSELNMKEKTFKEYFLNIDKSIDDKEKLISRLDDIESSVIHVITMSENRNNPDNQVEFLKNSLNSTKQCLNHLKLSISNIMSKLDTIKRDIRVMGARYGASITSALNIDYKKVKDSFALILPHLEFVFSSLIDIENSISNVSGISGPKSDEILNTLKESKELQNNVSELRDKIIDEHIS